MTNCKDTQDVLRRNLAFMSHRYFHQVVKVVRTLPSKVRRTRRIHVAHGCDLCEQICVSLISGKVSFSVVDNSICAPLFSPSRRNHGPTTVP